MDINHIYLVFVFSTLFLVLFAGAIVLFLVHYKRKQIHYYTEKMQLEHNYKTELLQTQLEVQEQSLNYFSEEVHDHAGQLLSHVKHHLHSIRINSTEPETIKTALLSSELLSTIIGNLRSISHTLNTGYIRREGLVVALETEASYISSAKDIECRITQSGTGYNMDDEKELLIFRIIQEAIANAIKHGAPTAIEIQLDYKPGQLIIQVIDNGSGFDTKAENTKAGIGLINMYNRAALIKGNLNIHSEKGSGTTIQLIVNHENERQ